jgi:outer membrane protein TolC
MPTFPDHHAYGAMVSMSLPWLNPGRRLGQRAAERTRSAEQSALRARVVAARFELEDAHIKLQAARETLTLLRAGVLADAKRSFEAAQAQLASGRGDVMPVLEAARSYLEVRIDELRARAEVESSQADYARAAGLPVVELARAAEAGAGVRP